jgi:soluble lytic murein transglycosylase-like protein
LRRIFWLTFLLVICFTITVNASMCDNKLTREIPQTFEWVPLDESLMEYIYNNCSEYEIDSEIFLALIDKETGGTFDEKLVSSTNDRGLCQINKRYQEYNLKLVGLDSKTFDAFDPYDSVLLSIKLLSYLKQQYAKDYTGTDLTAMMLSAYNMGMTGAERQHSEYTSYSKAVIKLSKIYEED